MMRFLVFVVAFAVAMPATAHVSVWPKESVQGAREKYEIRVPNEKQADTIALEVRFPVGLKVSAFEQKPGWNTEPLRDSSGAIVGVRWSGKLSPQQFTEFGLLAANPATGSQLVWIATQLYADGTRAEWSGEPGSKAPAPRVMLKPAVPRQR